MQSTPWSRSRYWLCHFLHNRHVRTCGDAMPIDPADRSVAEALGDLVSQLTAFDLRSRDLLVSQLVDHCGSDPAFVQANRLMLKEIAYHQKLGRKLTGDTITFPPSGRTDSVGRGKLQRALGPRFPLSLTLLRSILRREAAAIAADAVDKGATHDLARQVEKDADAHIRFLAERLTNEFADFNFVRRNLRRLRLRMIFGVMISRAASRHAASLETMGVAPRAFARRCRKQFETLLEQMVPYRRDELIARLVDQRENPWPSARP